MSLKKEKLLKKYLDKKRKQRKRDDLIAQIAQIDQEKESKKIKTEDKKEKHCIRNEERHTTDEEVDIISEHELPIKIRNDEQSSIFDKDQSPVINGDRQQIPINDTLKEEKQIENEVSVIGSDKEEIMIEMQGQHVTSSIKCINRPEEIQKEREKLPIFYESSEIISLVRNNTVILIKGATGSGKTTQIPQFLYEAGLSENGLICVTQPRRISTTSICFRINQEVDFDLCGFKIRYDSNLRAHHHLVTMTDGILLKEIQEDFLLSKYSTVILDEVHERSCNLDILISLISKIVKQRKDLKVILMSASDISNDIIRFFDGLVTYEVPQASHKLSIFYEEKTPKDLILSTVDRIKRIVREKKKEEGAILVFLPSKSDIYRLKNVLDEQIEATVLPLHSSLSRKEQSLVYKSYKSIKIILSTNIAETSITIPDVVYVIDSGLVKNKYITTQGIVQYTTEYISKSSALQRAGRAGRTCPGICYRMYSGDTYNLFSDHDTPRIQYEPLDSIVLDLVALGIKDVTRFPFISKPPVENIEQAISNLKRLCVIDKEGSLTKTGRIISKLPISPKLAKILCVPNTSHVLNRLIAIVSCLSVNFELKRNKQTERFFTSEKSDVIVILKIFIEYLKKTKEKEDAKFCLEHGLNYSILREASKMYQFLIKKFFRDCDGTNLSEDLTKEEKDVLRNILFRVYSSNMALPNTDSYFFKGINVHLASSSITPEEDAFLIFEYLSEGTKRIYMKNVTVVDKEWLSLN